MTNVTEIAPDVYRISVYNDNYKLQFNQFLIKDDEPLLFHTGMKGDFLLIRDAVARIVDPATIRWLSFSHFESDECGSLNELLQAAPKAQPLCTVLAALVNLSDFAIRTSRWVQKEEVVNTGKYRFCLYPTHHLPRSWDAGMLFEETNRRLFCSDLFLHGGGGGPAHGIRRSRKSPEGDGRFSIHAIAERHPLHCEHGAPHAGVGRPEAQDPRDHARIFFPGRRAESVPGTGVGHEGGSRQGCMTRGAACRRRPEGRHVGSIPGGWRVMKEE
jgi:hypothetical protein